MSDAPKKWSCPCGGSLLQGAIVSTGTGMDQVICPECGSAYWADDTFFEEETDT